MSAYQDYIKEALRKGDPVYYHVSTPRHQDDLISRIKSRMIICDDLEDLSESCVGSDKPKWEKQVEDICAINKLKKESEMKTVTTLTERAVGDVVYLKGEGKAMTVLALDEEEAIAECSWFDEPGAMHSAPIPYAALKASPGDVDYDYATLERM